MLAPCCSTSLVEPAVAELLNPRISKRKGFNLSLYVKIDLKSISVKVLLPFSSKKTVELTQHFRSEPNRGESERLPGATENWACIVYYAASNIVVIQNMECILLDSVTILLLLLWLLASKSIKHIGGKKKEKKKKKKTGNFNRGECQATVTSKDNSTTETYIGLTEDDFKARYRNHTASFQHAKHRKSTELSKHIWTLKNNNIYHLI